MGSQARSGGRYVPPIDSTGATPNTEGPQGTYTLTAGQHYYYVLGGDSAPFVSVHITGNAAIVITSATVQDCNHGDNEVTNFSTTAGEWIPETPTTAYVGTTGTGWSQTNGVAAALGTGAGGAMFHVTETAARRTRLDVLVGATGGTLKVSAMGKD